MPQKHPITGCRLDTIFGEWLIDRDRLEEYKNTAWMIVEKGELKETQSRSQEMHEAADDRPYTVQDGIARLNLSGPLTKFDTSMSSLFGGTSTMRVRDSLRDIRSRFDTGEVKGVFMEVDSPGGSLEGTAELASAVRKTAEKMPIYMHAPDTACSAALWIATQGTRFTAGPAARVGSLGTRVTLLDESKLGEDRPVKPVVKDTGTFKSIGAPGRPITTDQHKELQRYADNVNKVFVADVQKSRKMNPSQMEEAITARVFVGADAMRVGLIDAVCSTDEAFECAKQNLNNSKSDRRGPGPENKTSTALRSNHMPLQPSELSVLKTFHGAAGVTEETADIHAFHAAAHYKQLNDTLSQNNARLTGEVSRLTGELTSAKAAAPVMEDQRVVRGMCKLAFKELQMSLTAGKITSVQFAKMEKVLLSQGKFENGELSTDAVPVAAMFQADASGKHLYEGVFSTFNDNKPNGILQDVSSHQPSPRTEPGSSADAKGITDEHKKWGLKDCNQMLMDQNCKTISRGEFDAFYPESSGNS
jgi:signal peptide peptidase SppA